MGETVPETDLEPVTDYESFIGEGDLNYEFPEVSEDQPAGMCYTSGTTGMPKGVEYTHKMYWAHMGLLTGEVGLTARDVAMTVVPMFHVSGWGDRSRRSPPVPNRCSPARIPSPKTWPS